MNINTDQIRISPETAADYQDVVNINEQAFRQINEAQLVEKVRKSDRYIPELSLIAKIDGVSIGHILFSYIDLVGAEKFRVLGLAPMAVLPQFQNQGVGKKLITTGLEIADKKGEPLVIVLGHSWFYPKFGFVPSTNYQIESPFPVPEAAFMAKPLSDYQEKYRGKIIYPPAFSDV